MTTDQSNDPNSTWADFRRRMPVTEHWAYFDHAAVAPLSGPAQEAIRQWADDAACHGDVNWGQWESRLRDVRCAGAKLIGADPGEVALVRNTTEGISLVAEGFPWRPGDNVVTLADEFPSNQYPWMNLAGRGVETRRVDLVDGRVSLDAVAAACDDRTRILTVSWIGYASGWRIDVAEVARIAHDHGGYLFLDAIQGLGAFPLNVKTAGVDFLAADGHKWMLGPEGAGLFYVRRELLDVLRPLGVGWNSVKHAHDFQHIELTLKDTAARYEGGTYNTGGLVGLGASLDLLMECGIDRIGARILEITDLACRRLTDVGAEIASCREPAYASGIVSFTLPDRDPAAVRRQCAERGVAVNCRAGRIRISPHAYVNEEDVERLIGALVE